jgi:hypothetical protein
MTAPDGAIHGASMPFLSFPLRLRESGTLQRSEESSALLSFLQVMAVTPGGSWAACPNFGLRDLLESSRQRADSPRLAMERANRAFEDLGITGYRVQEIVRENSQRADFDVYSVTLIATRSAETYSTRITTEAV